MSEADLFLSGGAPAQKFPKEGFTWGGTILGWEMAQQTDLETGELKFWPDGKPQMQLILNMQGEPTGITWEGNAYREVPLHDDDGARRLFVKGGLQAAVGKALRDAGRKLEIGAYLEVTRTKDLPPTKKGYSGRHTFKAVWTSAGANPHAATIMLKEAAEAPATAAPAAADENPWA